MENLTEQQRKVLMKYLAQSTKQKIHSLSIKRKFGYGLFLTERGDSGKVMETNQPNTYRWEMGKRKGIFTVNWEQHGNL